MKVIGIVGMPGSGKGEFSAVADELGIPVVVMGDVIREEVKKEGLPPVDASMGVIARRLRAVASWKVSATMLVTLLFIVLTYVITSYSIHYTKLYDC